MGRGTMGMASANPSMSELREADLSSNCAVVRRHMDVLVADISETPLQAMWIRSQCTRDDISGFWWQTT
jgi:hypothetical protein